MNAKSNIYKTLEIIECRERMERFIDTLLEAYNIDDIVLGIISNEPQELVRGFMTSIVECEDMHDCLNRYDVTSDCIRICENKFYIGKFTTDVTRCEGNSMNIETFREF